MSFWRFFLENHTEVLKSSRWNICGWWAGHFFCAVNLIGIPLGILITRSPAVKQTCIGERKHYSNDPKPCVVWVPLPPAPCNSGARADRLAILALTLYALLPLIRNTYVGMKMTATVIKAGAPG